MQKILKNDRARKKDLEEQDEKIDEVRQIDRYTSIQEDRQIHNNMQRQAFIPDIYSRHAVADSSEERTNQIKPYKTYAVSHK